MNNIEAKAARSNPQTAEKEAFREAVKLCLPTMPGLFAWAMVTGMAMAKSGLTVWQALGMSLLVFAGSAQLSALPLMAANVPPWVVFVTALVVNLRFVIFAAAVAPHFAHLPLHKRVWYGYFNADITMAFFPQRFPPVVSDKAEGKVGFFTGIGYANWYVWQSGSVIGILLASQIPQTWGIAFAGTLALLTIMIPLVINTAALVGVAVAGAVAVAAAGLPYRLGLLVAVLCGMAAAMAVDTVLEKNKEKA